MIHPAVLVLAAFVPATLAGSDSIFTSRIQYCSSARAIEVENFNLVYHRSNASITFDLVAQSIASGLNPSIDVAVVDYGRSAVNISQNLCDVISGVLCPLPQYQFDGGGSYYVPEDFGNRVPAIAYNVPDLDAYATITLRSVDTGEEAACLKATLSNGLSVYDNRVIWAAAAVILGAFVATLLHSWFPLSPTRSGPEYRLLTMFGFYQHIAMCGLLSLDYPTVYKSFTLNFAWALGLIYIRPIQTSITNLKIDVGALNTTGLTFNVIQSSPDSSEATVSDTGLPNFASRLAKRQFLTQSSSEYYIPQVAPEPKLDITSGIATTAERIGIPFGNTFMTVFISFLLLCCIMIAISLLVVLITFIVTRRGNFNSARSNTHYFLWSNWLRTFAISYPPLTLFAFYSFLHKNEQGWVAIFFGAICLTLIFLGIIFIALHISKIGRKYSFSGDGTQSEEALLQCRRWSTVTGQFKSNQAYYFAPLLAATLVSSAFIAFAQGHPYVQVIALLVIEFILLCGYIIFRPMRSKASNAFSIIICIFRLIAMCLLICFIPSVVKDGIIRTVIGFVLLAVQSIMIIVFFFVVIFNLGVGLLWAKGGRRRFDSISRNNNAIDQDRNSDTDTLREPEMQQTKRQSTPSNIFAPEQHHHVDSPEGSAHSHETLDEARQPAVTV